MGMLLNLLVYVAIIGVAWWGLTEINPPRPIRIVAVVIIAIVAIYLLMGLVGGHPISLR